MPPYKILMSKESCFIEGKPGRHYLNQRIKMNITSNVSYRDYAL